MTTNPVRLNTLLEDRAPFLPLKRQEVVSPIVQFDFAQIKAAPDHFKPFVRELRFDAGELAIISYMQALIYGKDLTLLPVVVVGGFHHKAFVCNAGSGAVTPDQLSGKRIGVRTYSQTTAVWARGVLQNEYGVDPSKITWVTLADEHLTEYSEPSNCSRAPAGKKLLDMLLEREIDAAILGGAFGKDPRFTTVIPDAQKAQEAWHAKHGVTPINHMWVMKRSLSKSRPDVARESFRMLVESKRKASPDDMTRYGIEANRKALDLIIDYAFQQKVIPRRLSVDELFDETTRALSA